MIKTTKHNMLFITLIVICMSCVRIAYPGVYSKPRNVKVIGDAITLNKDYTYWYYVSNSEYFSTHQEKGTFKIIEKEYIIFYPDSTKDESIKSFKVNENKNYKYYLDTLYIFNAGKDCLLFGNWNCYMKLIDNKLINNDKYNNLCNRVRQNKKYGH